MQIMPTIYSLWLYAVFEVNLGNWCYNRFGSLSLAIKSRIRLQIIHKQIRMQRSNFREERPQRQNKESSVLCKHCGRLILADNYLIHEARCALISSRVVRPQNVINQEIRQEIPANNPLFRRAQSRKEEIRPSNQRISNREFSRMLPRNQSAMQEEIDRIPCHFCGYPQTLAELDTHPLVCEHRQQECAVCKNKFPKSLMTQHNQVCREVNQRSHEQSHMSERDRRWMDWIDEEPEQENYSPFGNLSSFLMNTRRNNHIPHNQGFTLIQTRDGNGVVRRQIISGPPGFIGQSRPSSYQNPYLPFTNFFAILERMAGRNGSQNQGLTKQEIKNLKRFKYQGNNLLKKEAEKDLCTICYCEFEKDEKLVQLKCKHAYHQECITKWVEKTAKCPVCKAPQTNRRIFQEQQEYM